MARKTFDPNSLTVDFRQLMRLSVQDRINLFRQGGQSYFESLTPTQLAQLFPKYYQQQLPDIGKAVSGGTKGTGGPPSFAGGGGGAGTPTGTATPSPRTSGGTTPSISAAPVGAPKPSQNAQENTILDKLESIVGGKADSGKVESQGFARSIDKNASFSSTLANQRAGRGAGSLSAQQKQHFYALAIAEMGAPEALRKKGIDPVEAYAAFMETPYNRGMTEKKAKVNISDNLQRDYYEPLRSHTTGYQNYLGAKGRLGNDKELFSLLDEAHSRVARGSNYSNLATQNSSAGVAASARTQQTITSEKYGETLSRKDIASYAHIHGAGTIQNTKRWVQETQKQILLEQKEKGEEGLKNPELTTAQKSEIRRDKSIMASSLEDPAKTYTKDSVSQMMKDGKKYFEINYDYGSAKDVAKMIEDAGGTVVAYNRGQQNTDPLYNERYRNVDSVVSEMMKNGKKVQHLDNTESKFMKYDEFKQIVEKANAAGITVIPKNPHLDGAERNNWIKLAKENPDLLKGIPYASVENIGSMDQNQINNLKEFQKLFPGVQINGVEWAGNKPSQQSIDLFTKNFGPVKLNPGSESGGYIFGTNAKEFPAQIAVAGETQVMPKQAVSPPSPLPKEILDNPAYQEFSKRLKTDEQKSRFDDVIRRSIEQNNTKDVFSNIQQQLKETPQTAPVQPQKITSAPTAVPTAVSTSSVSELQSRVADIRDLPIASNLKQQLSYAAEKTGVKVEIFSGGQPGIGTSTKRTGSTRHDFGNAADIKLYTLDNKGNKRYLDMTNQNDRKVMQDFVKHSVHAGATGVGAGVGYMGPNSLHIGGGKPASWGGSDWIEGARQSGLELRKNLGPVVPTEPTKETVVPSQQPVAATPEQPVPLEKRGITSFAGMKKEGETATPVSPTPMSSKDMGLTPSSSAPTATPATTAPSVEPQQQATATPAPQPEPVKGPTSNEYGGEYQATSEDMSVIDNRTGQAQFTFNRDEQLSLQDGRLKVTPENRTNPDNLKPANQVAQPQQQQQSSYENAAGMFSGLQPRPQSPMTVTSQTNFYDRLQPASMPQNDGIMRAYAQSIGFHDTLGSNYGYGTAATIRNGYDTIIS